MRRFSFIAAALLGVLLLSSGTGVARGSPFAGWTEEEIGKHRRRARSQVTNRLRKFLSSRSRIVYVCKICKGSGKLFRIIGSGRNRRRVVYDCKTCNCTGAMLNPDRYRDVFWNSYSPAVRENDRLRREMELQLEAARRDPPAALPRMAKITKTVRKDVEIHGNYATVKFEDRVGRDRIPHTVELIELADGWWIAHPDEDAGFVKYDYPEPGQEPEAVPLAPEAEPPAPESPPSAPPTVPEPRPGPTAKPLPEDPTGLFEFVGEVTVKHVEENAYKVMGQIRNTTKDRRFAYVLVEVSLFEGNTLVDTVTCNVGTSILKPGDQAAFSAFLYWDSEPEYDRIEKKVAGFEGME